MVTQSNSAGNFCIDSYKTYQNGQVVFHESSQGDWFYIVEEGKIELSKTLNGEKIVIETINPGGIFGEVSYILKVPRTATATAVGKTVVGIIDRQFCDQDFDKLSDHCKFILKSMAMRIVQRTGNFVKLKNQTLNLFSR